MIGWSPAVSMATFDIDVQHICVNLVAVRVKHEVVFAIPADIHGLHAAETDGDEGGGFILHVDDQWAPCKTRQKRQPSRQ